MIVGRSADLERLDRMTGRLSDGQGDRLLVVGDPGIGKTALLDVAQRRARARGIRVVAVQGAAGEDDLAFALLDDLSRVLGARRAVAALGVGGRADRLLQALVSTAYADPLLLVVDDAQFADDPSLAALALAVDRARDLPILTVVAMRPELAATARFTRWPQLRLGPLDDESSRAVLRAVLGPDGTPAVLAQLAHALGGNPLALREAPLLLRTEERTGEVRLPDPLPVVPLLSQAWGGILDRLPSETESALLDLAVAGTRLDIFGALRPEGRATADLQPAVDAGLVTFSSSSGPAFAHPLVREVVLERVGASRTCARHAEAARIAAERDLPVAVRLHHLQRMAQVPDDSLAAALEETALRAEGLDQYEVALAAWESAAACSTSAAERVRRATCGLGVVIRTGNSSRTIPALLRHVTDVELDPVTHAWVTTIRAGLVAQEDASAAVPALWAALDHASVGAPVLASGLLWEIAAIAWSQGLTDEAQLAADELAALTGPAAAPGARLVSTALSAAAAFQSGDVARSVPLRLEAAATAAAIDPVTVDLLTLYDVVFIDDLLLDLSPAAGNRLLVLMQRIVDEAEPLVCLWGIQAWRARARGDLQEARRLVVEGRLLLDALRDPRTATAVDTHAGLCALSAEIAAITGDEDTLRAETALLNAATTHTQDLRRRATGDRALGLHALAVGRLDGAATALSAAADVCFLGRGLRDAVLPARVDLVEVEVRRGDLERALSRADDVRPLLDAMQDPLASALSHRVSALVATDPADAAHHFAAAAELHASAFDTFEQARTLLLQGEHLRRHRRRSEARAALLTASSLFDRLGARSWAERVQVELRAAGGTPSQTGPVPDLTPQELAVAREVASGRSNREVADALFLSPRTVEYHLGNIYRKLGVHGRSGLTRAVLDTDRGSASVQDEKAVLH